jgi:hypothetical protein
MKIKLTLAEITTLVVSYYDLPDNTGVEIEDFPNTTEYNRALGLISEIKKLDYTGSEKIRAIKHFREIVSSGLAEAKWAIENFLVVEDFIHKNKRLPAFAPHTTYDTTRLM